MWCKTDGEKENRGLDGNVRIEGNSGSDGKGEWREMVRAFVEEEWCACLRKVLEFEVSGKRKPGWPKKTWKMQVEKDSKSNGLEKKDAMNQARWRMGVKEISAGVNPATPVHRNKPGSKLVWWFWWLSLYSSSLLPTTMGASCALFFANDILSSLHLSLLILF